MERCRVVAIGASADGFDALRGALAAAPSRTDLAFVVVFPGAADGPAVIESLSAATSLKVRAARDRQPLLGDHVEVAPPQHTCTIHDNVLHVEWAAPREGVPGGLDRCFRSLAADRGADAVAVVLSGTGEDGTSGAEAVDAAGGLVVVQAPATALQPALPARLIAAGHAHDILAPEELLPSLLDPRTSGRRSRHRRADANELPSILSALRGRSQHGFLGYERGALQRRIEQRMASLGTSDIRTYVELLQSYPAEVDRLAKALLIGQPGFFRDASRFDQLTEDVLRRLLRERAPDVPIRVWVPECGTGEEAYSIAMVLAEQIQAARAVSRIQIFATDPDDRALAIARQGVYPDENVKTIGAGRLAFFFTRQDGGWAATAALRASITFATHQLPDDPAFTHLDLICCRGAFTCADRAVRPLLLERFHDALTPHGHLLIGLGENLPPLRGLFAPLSAGARLLRRVQSLPASARSSTGARDVRPGAIPLDSAAARLADEHLLQHLAPTAAAVGANGQLLRTYGAIERYLHWPGPDAMPQVMTIVRDVLRPALSAALRASKHHQRPAVFEAPPGSGAGPGRAVRITVRPVATHLSLIVFEEHTPGTSPVLPAGHEGDDAHQAPASLVRSPDEGALVAQILGTHDRLRDAAGAHLSMAEERKAAARELDSWKGVLQTLSDDLAALDARIRDEDRELARVKDETATVLGHILGAGVVLDAKLRLVQFSPLAAEWLELTASDVGRPLADLRVSSLDTGDLAREARAVAQGAGPLERDATICDGRPAILRIVPYHSSADPASAGLILSWIDMTTLRRTARELEAAHDRLALDLKRMTRLHEATSRLMGPGEIRELLEEILAAAQEITGADMGTMQRYERPEALTLAAQRGFEAPLLAAFERVDATTGSACSAAMAARQRVIVEDVTASPVFAHARSQQAILAAGVRAVQSTPLFDRSGRLAGMLSTHYRAVHRFDPAELRWLDLLAGHAAELIERRFTEAMLVRNTEDLERRVAERTKWLTLMHDVTRAINDAPSWDAGLQLVLRRLCDTEHWELAFLYLPDREDPSRIVLTIGYVSDERFDAFQRESERVSRQQGDRLPGRVYVDGAPEWANGEEAILELVPVRAGAARRARLQSCVALPIKSGHDVIGVMELFSDHQHLPREMLVNLMNDVTAQIAKVLERERATAQAADLVWREQQALLHLLHDSLGQTLTGLGMLSSGLRQQLSSTTAAGTARQIAEQARLALDQVRQLSRGLFPVEIDAEGFLPALHELAATTEAFSGIQVHVEGEAPAWIGDARVATQLYRIAQEAVTNAVKHARAHGVRVEIKGELGLTTMSVVDDGVGIQKDAPQSDGLGLRIMRYRAGSIGAQLTIEAIKSGGTRVACTLREPPEFQSRRRGVYTVRAAGS